MSLTIFKLKHFLIAYKIRDTIALLSKQNNLIHA